MGSRTWVIEGPESACTRPVPHEDAVVLASINDKPCGGADAPSLTAAARAGALVERPRRENGSAGAKPENVVKEEPRHSRVTGNRQTSPFPFPNVVGHGGKRKWEVSGVSS